MPAPDTRVGRPALHPVGVTFVDTYHRTGLYPRALPFVPGAEGTLSVRVGARCPLAEAARAQRTCGRA